MSHVDIQAGLARAWGNMCIMLLYTLGWQGPGVIIVSCCYTGWGGKGLG